MGKKVDRYQLKELELSKNEIENRKSNAVGSSQGDFVLCCILNVLEDLQIHPNLTKDDLSRWIEPNIRSRSASGNIRRLIVDALAKAISNGQIPVSERTKTRWENSPRKIRLYAQKLLSERLRTDQKLKWKPKINRPDKILLALEQLRGCFDIENNVDKVKLIDEAIAEHRLGVISEQKDFPEELKPLVDKLKAG